MRSFRDSLATRLKDEAFRKEYENIQPEMDIIRAIIAARKEQNITQADLAARTKINQADISKLENGSKNPSLKMLKRLAEGLNMDLKIQFVPRTA
ncbi:MAG: helix-turn-helix transcriptional regulator [Schwartzia sp.]|nr:helix-turn-helix transcriptional regulator [Schwartzia sp. (in: firmicutes)]